MKMVVDLAVCQGYTQCVFLAPAAFRIYGEEALLYDPLPDDQLREPVVQAAPPARCRPPGQRPRRDTKLHYAADSTRSGSAATCRGGMMGQAIGVSLPPATGIALSPIPIIAVVLVMTSRRAKVNGATFVLGWLTGVGIVGVIVLALAGAGGASKSGTPTAWVNWVKIALGILLLLIAAREFGSWPHSDEQPQMPKWMATIDKTTPPAALGLGAAVSAANPKNLLLAVARLQSCVHGLSGRRPDRRSAPCGSGRHDGPHAPGVITSRTTLGGRLLICFDSVSVLI